MALLIHINQPDWLPDDVLADELRDLMPGVTLHCGAPTAPLPDVTVMATSSVDHTVWPLLPNLKLVQKLGAGVNDILSDPGLPKGVAVARLASDAQAREMAQYCLAQVLGRQHNLATYKEQAREGLWKGYEPRESRDITVCVLGLGRIGALIATTFAGLGYRTTGWSRTPKDLPGIAAFNGADGLKTALGEADFVIAILPSTPATVNLFDRTALGWMKPDAVLINIGRGNLIVEDDLIAALDAGRPGAAVLDVTRAEPLPADHPFWSNPAIDITPHISGWHVNAGWGDVAENYRRVMAGEPVLNPVDRRAGY